MTELCTVMQLPQSTVSRHLKALVDSGWIAARSEGTSHIYTMTRDDLIPPLDGCGCWFVNRSARPPRRRRINAACRSRCRTVASESQEFFSSSAGQWDRLRDDLFGDRVHLAALRGAR